MLAIFFCWVLGLTFLVLVALAIIFVISLCSSITRYFRYHDDARDRSSTALTSKDVVFVKAVAAIHKPYLSKTINDELQSRIFELENDK